MVGMATITNESIARDLGVSHSTVSRIRSGDRLPSVPLMVQIERAYNWSVQEQVRSRESGKYPSAFEYAVQQQYVG